MRDTKKEVKLVFPDATCVRLTGYGKKYGIINNPYDIQLIGKGNNPQGAWDNAWNNIFRPPTEDRGTS